MTTTSHTPGRLSAYGSDPMHDHRAVAALTAGPVMAVLWIAQGLVRDGYDFSRHPMSLLALGEGGWVQIVSFIITGGLILAGAQSLRESLAGGVGATWVPRLVTAMAIGMIASGVFTADPGAGFPAGAPDGAPDYSWHGVLHELASLLLAVSWIAACVILRRRFARSDQRGWAWVSALVIPLALAIVAVPHQDSLPARMALAGVLQLAFVGAAAHKLHSDAVSGNVAEPRRTQ